MNHKMLSLADQIFNQLQYDILTGVYEKDELLTEIKLSEQLGVSRTPVREALSRLGQENLVEVTTKGAKVIGISEKDITDIYEIRSRIEYLAARGAAENATDEELKEFKRILDLQEFYTKKGDNELSIDADSDFHSCLYRICGNRSLMYTLAPLHRRIIKYRRVSFETPQRALESLKEHTDIYNAIAAHDADLAEKLMNNHIHKAHVNMIGGKE